MACIAENKLPPGVIYRPVDEEESGAYPEVKRRFVPRLCNHCDNPPCVPVCPVKPKAATGKHANGIVAVDYELCIGCLKCQKACPYGARYFDEGDYYTDGTPAKSAILMGQEDGGVYERATSYEYGKAWSRTGDAPPVDKVRKCQFCVYRLESGLLPQCVTTCIGRATSFGDAADPSSLVSGLLAAHKATRLKDELGTQPRVYYLDGGTVA